MSIFFENFYKKCAWKLQIKTSSQNDKKCTFKQKAGAPTFGRKRPYVSQDALTLQFKMPKWAINEIINNPENMNGTQKILTHKIKKKHPKWKQMSYIMICTSGCWKKNKKSHCKKHPLCGSGIKNGQFGGTKSI